MIYNSMFWHIFILCGHATLEPALITCNDKQCDLFYSTSPKGDPHQPNLIQGESAERFWNKWSWMGRESKNVIHGYMLIYSRLEMQVQQVITMHHFIHLLQNIQGNHSKFPVRKSSTSWHLPPSLPVLTGITRCNCKDIWKSLWRNKKN